MNASDLMSELHAAGITVEARDGKIQPTAGRGTLTTELLADVKSFKAELLKVLQSSSLLPGDLGGSGSRSPGAASVAQVSPTETLAQTSADGDNYADREFRRFAACAVPMAGGNGWRDPAEPVLPRGVTGENWQRFIDDCGCLGKAVRV